MTKMKYFEAVEAAQRDQKPVDAMPPFDPERMRTRGLGGRIVSRFLENPRWALALLRRFRPTGRIGPLVVVTRAADVREVLERQDVFHTPFGPEMAEMAGGANFILGMQDGPAYRRLKSAILRAFRTDEIETRVRPLAARHSREIMLAAEPGFDFVGGLLKIVPVRICRDYFGLLVEDEESFADWSIALSSLFFADFFASPVTRELAVVAADRMRGTIRRSMAAVREGVVAADTPLGRLVALHDADPAAITEPEIVSAMMGMVSGFAPTNLLAAGNALDVVLSRRDARDAVEEAVKAGDDRLLDAAIMEAMRFKPINIGPLRHTARDTVISNGRDRYEIKAGTTVMAATLSAMFDPEAVNDPERFDPARPAKDSLVFGHGIHWCIGSAIARVQIAEAFRVLFSRPNVRRARGRPGRLTRRGAFPEHLHVAFDRSADCRTVAQAKITVVAPVVAGANPAAVRQALDGLGNPAGEALHSALGRTGIVHFASLSFIEPGDPRLPDGDLDGFLVLEISADGGDAEVLAAIAAHAGDLLRPVLARFCGLGDDTTLEGFLRAHAVAIAPGSPGKAGLAFSGAPGHSVKRIRAEAALEAEISGILRGLSDETPGDATGTLREVRRRLIETGRHDWALQPAESLLERPAGSLSHALASVLLRPGPALGVAALLVLLTWVNYAYVFGGGAGLFRQAMALLAAFGLTLVGVAIVAAALAGLLLLAVRRMERRESSASDAIPLDRYREVVVRENHAVQNNLTAVSIMKPGLLRQVALRTALTVVSIYARFVFRPGFLSDIGTIHFARWILIPGTRKLVFFSNYGGSWESYLEDFITKAARGLTGVWSNTLGFPDARFLFLDGAEDGDRFKRWARFQQIPTRCWYSAYPDLDTRRIRINSAIRQGLVRVGSESEARAWLDLFGSLPRPADLLETDEIQALFFGPMGRLREAEMVAIAIPEGLSREARRDFMLHILQRTSFGDRHPQNEAMIVGFGPGGLARLGLESGPGDDPLDAFPPAFRQGMADRAGGRILDDMGPNAPENWRWGAGARAADAVVLCYADTKAKLKDSVEALRDVAQTAGMRIVERLPLTIEERNGLAIEHFGFADGLSQPVVRGTPRAHRPTDPQHMVAAGEFVFGYRDQRGNLPLSPVLAAARDGAGLLARAPDDDPRLVGGGRRGAVRDFGRNGTFLVVRQLEQHVERFETFCREASAQLATRVGEEATPEWIGAKMVGRWKDGTSLVRNPHGVPDRRPDNDFAYGPEDPQGTRCPLGAHIRRSNPRDSLGADHARQMELSKRHRILRVGRTYRRGRGANAEKGLLFMCLNADIERQFEFVQQTWIAAGLFHGLASEKDPLIGAQTGEARFTIPSVRGAMRLAGLPDFVTLRGGGYFFMPSLRALRYMHARL